MRSYVGQEYVSLQEAMERAQATKVAFTKAEDVGATAEDDALLGRFLVGMLDGDAYAIVNSCQTRKIPNLEAWRQLAEKAHPSGTFGRMADSKRLNAPVRVATLQETMTAISRFEDDFTDYHVRYGEKPYDDTAKIWKVLDVLTPDTWKEIVPQMPMLLDYAAVRARIEQIVQNHLGLGLQRTAVAGTVAGRIQNVEEDGS